MLRSIQNIFTRLHTLPFGALNLVFAGTLMMVIPFADVPTAEKPETYVSHLQVNLNNMNPVTVPEKQVKVYSSGSREDLQNLDPEAIKGLMQAVAPEYGVDWKLVYAIGYHESGNFQSSLARRQNNFFGRKASSTGYAAWATPEEGIRDEFQYLKEHYFDQGLTTPASINHVYAEDQSWHYAVESVMASL